MATSYKAAKKTAKKATKGKAKAAVVTGKCRSWKAWLNIQPPGPWTLHVTGVCRFPTHGYKVTLKPAASQGINKLILLLQKVVKPPTGPVIMIPQDVLVKYSVKTKIKYNAVTILPDGTTVKVQIVT
jgi:hypothetical protein